MGIKDSEETPVHMPKKNKKNSGKLKDVIKKLRSVHVWDMANEKVHFHP